MGYHPDGLHNEATPPQGVIPIEATPAQAKKIRELIEKARNNPSKYDLFTYNCITFVRELLKEAGYNVPDAGFTPADFWITLQILSHTGGIHSL